MGGHNAVGTPSGPRRCSADGKIALGLQSQTSVRQAASVPMPAHGGNGVLTFVYPKVVAKS